MIERDVVVYHWAGPPEIALHRAEVELPTGVRYTAHWLVTAGGAPGVVMCAVRADELLLVRSSRPTAGLELWELPRGFGEPDGGGPADDAARELREETGYPAEEVLDLGGYVTDSSVLPTRVRVLLCRVPVDAEPTETDGETSERRWVPLTSISALVTDGTLADAHSLAALTLASALWR